VPGTQLFKLDFADASPELPLLGSPMPASERFHRLAWGTTGVEGGAHPYGIIAGGLVDGCVNLWSPSKVAEGGAAAKSALICPLRKHTGAVKGLEFNGFSPNLLASGAADGDLCIWDLANPAQPSLYPALKGPPAAPGQGVDVTHLSWNRKVQHILASTSSGGTTVVWDLKRQRQVISFTDPNMRRRCSALQWNPEVATQLVVASDDDRSPTLQVWDLRNSISPLREFVGHEKGVLSLAWCQADSSLLLSSGKDNRTICWDATSGEPLCELPASSNWNFDVQWSPTFPGVFSTASFDGKVGVYNLTDMTAGEKEKVVNEDFSVSYKSVGPATPLKKAPAWLKKPCGATFGFGGRLVSFGAQKLPDGSSGPSMVTIKAATFAEALAPMEDFNDAISDQTKLKAYCERKAGASGSAEEAETWAFLQVLFEDNARRTLLTKLGYEAAAEPDPVAEAGEAVEAMAVNGGPEPAAAEPAAAPVDDADFFDNLPEQTPEKPKPKPAAPEAAEAEDLPIPDSELDDSELEVQKCLVTGNYEGAVKECLKKDRMADALLLASMEGGDLWEATKREYMARAPQPYMRVVSAIFDKKLEKLVTSRPLGKWRETLAMLCTYANSDEWTQLCEELADKLAGAGMTHPAILCYICSGSTESAVENWSKGIVAEHGSLLGSIAALQDLIEKAVVLGVAAGPKQSADLYSGVLNTYAQFLASQGKLELALNYLSKLPGDVALETAILKDRIYRAGGDATAHLEAPPFPFEADGSVASTSAPAAAAAQPAAAAAPAPAAVQPITGGGYNAYSQSAYAAQPAAQDPYGGGGYQQQQQSYQQPASYANSTYNQGTSYGGSQGYNSFGTQQPYAQSPTTAASTYQPAAAASTYQPVQTSTYAAAQPAQFQTTTAPQSQYSSAAQPAVFQPPSAAVTTTTPEAQPRATVQQAAMFTPTAHSTGAAAAATTYQPAAFQPTAGGFGGAPQQAPRAAPAPAEPAKPAKPSVPSNISIDSADTSKVAADAKPVVATLTGIYQQVAQANPARKKELSDVSKKLGTLFFKLNIDDVSPGAKAGFIDLCAKLAAGDYPGATAAVTQLTTKFWDELGPYLTAVKRLQKLGNLR